MNQTAALTLRGISKSFGGLSVLRDVNLEVPKGERHALIGPNGAGKSTLFNMISGFFPPDDGKIFLGEKRIDQLRSHAINRCGLSRSFQITNIFPRLSVFENVRLGVFGRYGVRFGFIRSASGYREANQESERIIANVRLQSSGNRLAGQLTYSEQRALEIALTLASGADVILLDEPTAGMSREETAYMVDLIRRVTEHKTLLVIEHDMDVVFTLCDRISVLVYGNIMATGTPEEIRADAEVQKAYLGVEADHISYDTTS